MVKKETEQEIIKIVSEITKLSQDEICLDSHITKDLSIDSFSALAVVFALERKYGISIPEDELGGLTTVKELSELISKLLDNEENKHPIQKINIALTNRCNLKCRYCDIWKEKPKRDISQGALKKILNSKVLAKNVDITLTGGEPFLHKDLFNIIALILKKKPECLKTISTNGTLKDEILIFIEEFKNCLPSDFALHISIDGIRANSKVRGYPASKIIKNIAEIKKKYPFIDIKIKITASPVNYREIIPTYLFAKSRNLDFKVKLIEYAKNYTNRKFKPEIKFSAAQKKSIAESLLFLYKENKGNKDQRILLKEMVNFLLGRRKGVLCRAPFNRIFAFADGAVFSCIYFDKIGNLGRQRLSEIWSSKKAENIRKQILAKGCKACVSPHGFDLF